MGMVRSIQEKIHNTMGMVRSIQEKIHNTMAMVLNIMVGMGRMAGAIKAVGGDDTLVFGAEFIGCLMYIFIIRDVNASNHAIVSAQYSIVM